MLTALMSKLTAHNNVENHWRCKNHSNLSVTCTILTTMHMILCLQILLIGLVILSRRVSLCTKKCFLFQFWG